MRIRWVVLLLSGWLAWSAVGNEEEPLLDAVLRQQAEARAKVQNYCANIRYEGEFILTRDGRETRTSAKCSYRVIAAGARKHVDGRYEYVLASTSPVKNGAADKHLVLNDKYVAVWETGLAIFGDLTLFEHDSPEAPTQGGVVALSQAEPEDLLRLGFGCRVQTLEQLVSDWRSKPGRSVKAVRAEREGASIVRVEGYLDAAPSSPVLMFDIDPKKGYLVVEAHEDLPDLVGWGTLDLTLEAREAAPGRWFPERITYTTTSRPQPEGELTDRVQVTLTASDVQLDPPVGPGTFTWQSLGYAGKNALIVTPEGIRKECRVRNGQLVPVALQKRVPDESDGKVAAAGAHVKPRSAPPAWATPVALVSVLGAVVLGGYSVVGKRS